MSALCTPRGEERDPHQVERAMPVSESDTARGLPVPDPPRKHMLAGLPSDLLRLF